MKKPFVHVVPQQGKWAVEEEGHRPKQSFTTQKEAVESGRELAKRNHVELIIHGRDGTIRKRDSYGHDPRNVPG